ncbi:hypothetical protein ACHAPQ_005041 [Fusarium lateritium]
MQIKTLLLAPLLAAGVSAAPKKAAPKNEIFQGLALRSASDIHFTYLQASQEHFSLKLKDQKASCDRGVKANQATLSLQDGNLYLYKTDNPPQQVYVDRSGMGQGVLGYTTGAQPKPKNGEYKGWSIDKDGDLKFDGASFIACPSNPKKPATSSWSVWVSAGVAQPGGNKGCLGFNVRAAEVKKPVGCLYSGIPAQ